MPFRSPAAMLYALLLGAVAVLIAPASSAQAASFMDAAGRRVVLPDVIGRKSDTRDGGRRQHASVPELLRKDGVNLAGQRDRR